MTALSQLANKHRLAIIEDAAQAIGASYTGSGSPQNPAQGNDQEVTQKVGTLGDIGCFSFFPTKNLGAMGDAGMCTTNNDELAERLRMLRVHGSRQRYYHDEQGLNSRLDEIQAAVLRVKLPYIDQWNEARRQLAKRYNNAFSGLKDALKLPILEQDGMQQVFHQYTVQLLGANPVVQRETIQAALLKKGVQTMVYYPVPLYRQKTHANLQIVPEIFPVCERVCSRVLSLPIYPELTPEEQDQVCAALVQVFQSRLSALSL
jgi:dTDP-4-amino-4,6-dideoxygalactose transaminase